jgi:hypothetical protein
MLSKDHIIELLKGTIAELKDDSHFLDGYGYDSIVSLLTNLRTVSFPAIILEGRGTGTINLVEGPVDRFSQSIWVMGRLGRDEDETALYDDMFKLMHRVLVKILAAAKNGDPQLAGWNWRSITYMKRYGGQDARGYEVVLTFEENISLVNG